MNDGHTRAEVEKRLEAIRVLKAEIDWLLKDQQVTIVSNYNGQPYGRSRKPLTGQTARIKSTYLSEWMGPRVTVFIEGERVGLNMDAIRLSDDLEPVADALPA